MSLLTSLQAQVTAIQAQIAVLQSAPEDTYNFGTVALFSAATGLKFHYAKVAEETWKSLNGTDEEKPLREWILNAKVSNIGYFEVYIMTPGMAPIYSSS